MRVGALSSRRPQEALTPHDHQDNEHSQTARCIRAADGRAGVSDRASVRPDTGEDGPGLADRAVGWAACWVLPIEANRSAALTARELSGKRVSSSRKARRPCSLSPPARLSSAIA